MTSPLPTTTAATRMGLARFVAVEPDEVRALIGSFAMFFTLLAGYYVVRPLRDEMGVSFGKDSLHQLFTIVFFVMLAAVPAFGFIASRAPRRLVLPAVYGIVIVCLVGFWLLFHVRGTEHWSSGVFFVFGGVFNLFVVSLFWALMAELWRTGEAKRLYGFISAGGTAGALAGPLLTQGLIRVVAPLDLLLVAAALFAAAMAASFYLRRVRAGHGDHEERPAGGGILDGARKVVTDPFFRRIALYILFANVIGTFFYLEQARLVAATLTDSASRVQFFSSRDLLVSIVTVTIELFGTALVIRRFGLGVALMALPVCAVIGTLSTSSNHALWVVAAAMVAERIVAFSLANPAVKILYTTATPDEKYKVQNFVDTVVYRGGDAAAGWLFTALAAGVGFASAAVPAVAIPVALIWLWNASALGRAYLDRAGEDGKAGGVT